MSHTYGMTIRTTIDLPSALHERLRREAHESRTSMKRLIVAAVEDRCRTNKQRRILTGPLVTKPLKLGPRFPDKETPYDLLLP